MAFIKLPLPVRPTPTIHRTSEDLAGRHGFSTVEQLAESLPSGAEVIDVGASVSRLGHDVANLRSDITWVNFDLLYLPSARDVEITTRVAQLIAEAPKNLEYVGGSILDPPSELKAQRFARVFSFYVLPHIVEHNPRHGLVAAWNMIQLGEPANGIISVGPRRSYSDNAEAFAIPESDKEATELAVMLVKPWAKKS
jgi:hypothetical protein